MWYIHLGNWPSSVRNELYNKNQFSVVLYCVCFFKQWCVSCYLLQFALLRRIRSLRSQTDQKWETTYSVFAFELSKEITWVRRKKKRKRRSLKADDLRSQKNKKWKKKKIIIHSLPNTETPQKILTTSPWLVSMFVACVSLFVLKWRRSTFQKDTGINRYKWTCNVLKC